MSALARLRSWLGMALSRRRLESDMDAELRFHIEAYAEDLVRGAVPREEAVRRARVEFGGLEQTKEACRQSRGMRFFDELAQDVRYGCRTLRQNFALTAVAILTIALGIGLNVGIFSVLNGFALRLLPVHRADE